MRILTVVTEAPPIRSGIAAVTDSVGQGLRQLGHDVDLLTVADVGRWQVGEIRLTGLARHWSRISRDLDDYDVVNLHGPAPTFSDAFLALWRTLPRRRRPGLVYTHHSEIGLTRGRMLCSVYNRVHARLARAATAVVVSTPSYREMAIRAGAQRVAVIPWGVDHAAPPPSSAPRSPRFTVAFIGQLRPYKGVEVLLRAAAALPDVRFEIAGTGHQEEHLRTLAAGLGLANVTWHGAVSDAERTAILARAHVIALPSLTRAEAFGIVLLEGMQAGCVPVASDLPGVRDLAGVNGLLCRPGDPRSLLQAICYLRDDPDEWARRSAAAVIAAGGFRWAGTALAYARVASESALRTQLLHRPSPRLLSLLDLVRGVTLSDRASVLVADENSDRFDFVAVTGRALPAGATRPHRPSQSVAGQALATWQPVVLPGRATASPFDATAWEERSGLCVPFRAHRGAVRGVLNLTRSTQGAFVADEVRWAHATAHHVAERTPDLLPTA